MNGDVSKKVVAVIPPLMLPVNADASGVIDVR